MLSNCYSRACRSRKLPWMSGGGPQSLCATFQAHRRSFAAGLRGREEECRVDEGLIERHRPMQMRPRHATGCTNLAEDIAPVQVIAGLHADLAQMAVHGDQSFAVVHDDRVAREEEIAR